MSLNERVFELVQGGPRSGGALIEQLPLESEGVMVYGALAELARDGRIFGSNEKLECK